MLQVKIPYRVDATASLISWKDILNSEREKKRETGGFFKGDTNQI